MRNKNILGGFSDFNWNDVVLSEQEFEDFKSKYLDEYQRIKSNTNSEKVSILNDVDFELELIQKDEINVAYILKLLVNVVEQDHTRRESEKAKVLKLVQNNPQLRSKRELIEEFIETTLDGIDPNQIEEEFDTFVEVERQKSFKQLVEEENLLQIEVSRLIDTYVYDGRTPLKDDVAKTMRKKPKLLERRTVVPRLLEKITGYVEKFY